MDELQDGLDKYHHANANCDSAAISKAHALWAIFFSIAKEIKDYYVKVHVEHRNAHTVFIDCMKDLKADLYGIMKAKEPGCCSDKVKDVYDIFE